MRRNNMVLWVAGLGLIWGISGCAWVEEPAEFPAEVQAEEQAGLAGPDGAAAAAFERAGFELLATKEDFTPIAAVSQSEQGLVLIGNAMTDADKAPEYGVWRLKDNAYDPIVLPEGFQTQISGMVSPNHVRTMLLSATKMVEQEDGMGQVSALHVIHPDGRTRLVTMDEATSIYALSMNDDGVVVGWYTITGQMIAYCWSAEFGGRQLKDLGLSSSANAISDEGVIVGQAVDPETSKFRAMIWSLDGEGEALPAVEGYESSNAVMADGRGRVLVSHFNTKIYRDGKVLHHSKVGQAYVWKKKQGYTRVKSPEGLSAFPLAMSDRGEVLLRCTKAFSPKEIGTIVVGDFYLSASERVVRLPAFPGASFTQYVGMSADGTISGVANFAPREGKPTAVGFVIRAKAAE